MAIVSYKHKEKPISKESDKIILSNRLYVPRHLVTKEMLEAFTFTVGEPCQGCNCDDPQSCPASGIEELRLWREYRAGTYFGFLRGDIGKLKKLVKWDKVEDQRSRRKMKYPIKFLGTLRPEQKELVDNWLKKKYGAFKAPPRFGKTVVCAYLACELGYQTLILVDQDELADQFYKTFMNLNEDKKGNKIEFTDAPYIERKHKKTVVGIAKSLKDLEQNWPITIMTYQKWIRHIKKLKQMRDKWGLVFVDEYHVSSAPVWTKILNILNPKIRSGCSATPKRKDQLHCKADNTLGPVVAEGKTKQLNVWVEYFGTPHKIKSFRMYTTLISRMCADDKRNDFIVDKIAKDADKGRHILATTMRVAHAKRIARLLEMQGYKVESIVGSTPNRKEIFDKFKKGKIQIIVANRQITQKGLDLPILDCHHILVPNFNPYNLEQEASRCRTPYDGKPDPLIRVYIDRDHKITFAIRNAFLKTFDRLGFKTKTNNYQDSNNRPKFKKGWM